MKIDSLLLAVPVGLFVLGLVAALTRGGRLGRWAFLPAVVSCHAVAALLLVMGGFFRPAVRLELRAMQAMLVDASGQPVRVTLGGADGRDGGPADTFLVPDYPAAAFELRKDTKGGWHLQPGSGWKPELLAWSGGKPVTMKPGLPALVPLFPGDRLSLPTGTAEKPPVAVTYDEKQPWKREAALKLGARSWVLPNREIELPVLGWQVRLLTRQSWRQRVYALSEAPFAPTGLKSVIVNGMEHEELLGAHLLVLDEGLTVAGSAGLRQETKSWTALEPGATLRFDELLPAQNGRTARLVTRRSFRAAEIVPQEKGMPARISLRLERPQVLSLPLAEVTDVPAGQVPRLLVNDRFQHQPGLPNLRFSLLTSRHDQANAELREEKAGWLLRDDRGDRAFAWDQPLWLGRDHVLEVVARRAGVPARLAGLCLLGGLLSVGAFFLMPAHGMMGGLFFGLSYLACMRLLHGHAAWVNAPHDAGAVAVAAQVVWMLPVVLCVFWLLVPQVTPRLRAWLAEARRGWTYPSLTALALTLLAARVVLGLVGFKEALLVGGSRVALSMFFVPAHLVLFSLALCRLEADRRQDGGNPLAPQWRFLGFIYGVFFPAQLVAGVFVSDLGTFLYFLPPTVVLSAQGLGIAVAEARALLERRGAEGESRVMALIGALLFLLPAAGLGAVMANPLEAVSVFPEVRAAIETPDRVVTESNVLRLMQFIDEESLAAMGTDEAERIAQDHALMRSYAHRGLLGDGFLGVKVVHAKRETALNDNVFAVYGLAQFGVLGGLCLITAYAAVMLGGGGCRRACAFGRHLALLAALALGLTSLYMMGANTGLLPFTGRNMYLLGLNSLGDVAETAVLVLLVVAGCGLREKEAAA